MNPVHIVAALVVAIALTASHWKAYKVGGNEVQAKWNEEIALRTSDALTASRTVRAIEHNLNEKARKANDDFQAEKARRLAADAAASDSLLRLNAALARPAASASDPAPASRADGDPRNGIIAECAAALVEMDKFARRVADQLKALQRRTTEMYLGAGGTGVSSGVVTP